MTLEHWAHVTGPFFHGTAAALAVGDEMVPGHGSNDQQGRVLAHVYVAAALETAVWGAGLAGALTGSRERGRVDDVEPTGPFEDDRNVTDNTMPGNPTLSYRSRHALRVIGEVTDWESHEPAVLQGMLDALARLRAEGRDLIEA